MEIEYNHMKLSAILIIIVVVLIIHVPWRWY